MEKMPETIRIKEFRTTGKLPDFMAELPKTSKEMAKDIERLYSELATRVNWLLGYMNNGRLDMPEITEPGTPDTNKLRLYTESIKGFSFFKFIGDTGMKRAIVRDSIIPVKNVRGTSIAANRIVYATGSEDDIPIVDLAKADSISTLPAIGVTIESIADGAYGRVMQVGLLENINTNSLTEGDILYVSATTAGVPSVTVPVTPNYVQEIGTVLVKSATVGAIQIIARTVQNIGTGDLWPLANDTYYLGKNDDDTPFAWKGLILKDTTDGKYYRIEVINGVVTATDLTD
jgi:hypothetical protein